MSRHLALPHRSLFAPSMVMPGLVPGTHADPRHRGCSGRAGAIRGTAQLGAAWVAGTSPAMTGERVGIVSDPAFASSPAFPHPLHSHARACPGHPRRPAPSRVPRAGPGPSGDGAARRGVGGRDKPGHDGREGGDRCRATLPSLTALSLRPLHSHARACPGHPRRPAPSRVLGPGRGRPGDGAARRGVGGRDEPGHDGREGVDRWRAIGSSLDRFPPPSPPSCPGIDAG